MTRIILVLLLLCSCTTSKKSIALKEADYLNYNGKKYISTNIDTLTKKINQPSLNKIAIINIETDTRYIFSTVLSNPEMLYSQKNLSYRNKTIYVHSFYEGFENDASHSGIKKFNFVRVLPKDSLVIYFNKQKIIKATLGKPAYKFIEFTYVNFKKHAEYTESGIYNITDHPLKETTIRQTIK